VRTTTPEGNSSEARAGVQRRKRPSVRLLLALCLLAHPAGAAAQLDAFPPVQNPVSVRWWHGAVVLGGVSALMLLDQPSQRLFQRHRSEDSNELAMGLRHFGQLEVYGTITAGVLATGVLSGNTAIIRSGGRLATTLALAGAASSLAKLTLGRPRPDQSEDADGYVPFSGQEAMPSGHTTMAFALATALSDDIDQTWASVGLYTMAAGVAWSRLNDNRHWLSDVAAGAALGITAAKVINGRWRVFNLRPPTVLLGPTHVGVAWQLTF
jgi:membrane-associated phospholipid phosphatase